MVTLRCRVTEADMVEIERAAAMDTRTVSQFVRAAVREKMQRTRAMDVVEQIGEVMAQELNKARGQGELPLSGKGRKA